MALQNHTGCPLIEVDKLKPHKKNRNRHPKKQITRLAKILKYQGWRYPIKVSKRSGMITSGHGRLSAALLLGEDTVPVSYQDYDDEDQEIADLTADNAVALWSDLDLAGINFDLADFDPDFDIDLLGIDNFKLDMAEHDLPPLDDLEQMRDLRLSYTQENYDHVMTRLDQLSDKLGIDDHSQLIAHLLDINL